MRRIHLFEFGDQKWIPSFLRNYMTDFLSHLANQLKVYDPILPILEKGLKSTQENTIVDLCSGAGGGWLHLGAKLHDLNPKIRIILTDYFPNLEAMDRIVQVSPNILSQKESIDARMVPDLLKGLRTLFLSFHHFRPKDAISILQNSVDSNQPIAIFEGQERSLPSLLGMVFSPITLLLVSPFLKPFRFKRILFTYLIPLLPILVLWDGVVSCLRTYSIAELSELIDKVEGKETFNWETGKLKSGPGKILYLLGTPK